MKSNRKWNILRQRSFLGNEEGMVLLMALALSLLVITMVGAGMMSASSGLKVTSNHKNGVEAFYIAEAGVELARQTLGNTQTGLNEYLPQSYPFGEDKNLGNSLNGGYFIVRIYDDQDAGGDPDNDTNNRVFIESTGHYNSSKKRTTALVEVSINLVEQLRGAAETIVKPSTCSGDPYCSEFDIQPGGSIDGRDWDPPADGNIAGCVVGTDIGTCGTLTGNPTTYGAFTNTESTETQISNGGTLVGTGCLPAEGCSGTDPATASQDINTQVAETRWDSFTDQMKDMARRTLDETALSSGTNAEGCSNGTCTWGTRANPQITVVNVSGDVSWGATIKGAGVLILESSESARLSGPGWLHWEGIVIARATSGDMQFEPGSQGGVGGARIFGMVVSKAPNYAEIEFENTTGFVKYSSAALNLVKGFSPGGTTIKGWREDM